MQFLKGAANKYLNSDDKPTTAAHPGANIGGQGSSNAGAGNFSFLQDAAGKYMGSEDHPSAGGNGGGLEWENLARLTDQYSYLDKNKDGNVDAKDFLGL